MKKTHKRWRAVVLVVAVTIFAAIFTVQALALGLGSTPKWIYDRVYLDDATSPIYSYVYGDPWIPSAAYGYQEDWWWRLYDKSVVAQIYVKDKGIYTVYDQAKLQFDFAWTGKGTAFAGALKYSDARMKVYVSGAATATLAQNTDSPGSNLMLYTGAYVPVSPGSVLATKDKIPKIKPKLKGGEFLLFVEQRGYRSKPFFWISFYGGEYDQYQNGGILKGGSIKFKNLPASDVLP